METIWNWLKSLFVTTEKVPFRELRRGMMNDAGVADAQVKLKRLGFYPDALDDDFGPKMETATKKAQAAAGLVTKDGVIREELMKWMDAELSRVTPTPLPVSYPILSWEKADAKRSEWSDYVFSFFEENYDSFLKAKDWKIFRADWDQLTKTQKIGVMGEFISALTFYESGWNPASNSVDVGTKGSLDTYSVGLMQMSVTDQKNRGYKFGYTFEDLKKWKPGLHLGLMVLRDQIVKKGLVRLKTVKEGLYWAVISDGGPYDKTAKIAAKVNAVKFDLAAVTVLPSPVVIGTDAPWMKVVAGEMGQKEIAGAQDNPRIEEYHSKTSLKATDDETPWCSSFVNWVFWKMGMKRTNSAAAKSWETWGVQTKPRFGAVVVMPRTGGNHVTFWLRAETQNGVPGFIGRGGNQGNQVKDSWYANKTVTDYRWPVA